MPSIEKKITVCWDEEEVAEIIRAEDAEGNTGPYGNPNRGSKTDRIDIEDGRVVMRASVSVELFQRLAVDEASDDSIVTWDEGEVECSAGCVSVSFETTRGM